MAAVDILYETHNDRRQERCADDRIKLAAAVDNGINPASAAFDAVITGAVSQTVFFTENPKYSFSGKKHSTKAARSSKSP